MKSSISGGGGAFAQKVVEQISKKKDLPLDTDIYGLEQSAYNQASSSPISCHPVTGTILKPQNQNMTTPSMQTIEHQTLEQNTNPQRDQLSEKLLQQINFDDDTNS